MKTWHVTKVVHTAFLVLNSVTQEVLSSCYRDDVFAWESYFPLLRKTGAGEAGGSSECILCDFSHQLFLK